MQHSHIFISKTMNRLQGFYKLKKKAFKSDQTFLKENIALYILQN